MDQLDRDGPYFDPEVCLVLAILGIDIGKADFHAALLVDDRIWSKSFPNRESGFVQLQAWLCNRKVERVHACMESTGGFEESLALVLHELNHIVSIVNPSQVKSFGQSELLRTKTDAVDAALIARFCRAHRPEAWTPPAPEIRALQALVRRYSNVQDLLVAEKNRLEAGRVDDAVGRSLHAVVAFLEQELKTVDREIRELIDRHPPLRRQRELLVSIPGIGELTASRILGEMPNVTEYRNAKAVAAFAGLSPREHQSGNSRGRTRLAKTGNARLRKALYFPALAAIRSNPALRPAYLRLIAAGKPPHGCHCGNHA